MAEIDGKVIAITGAGSGIGAASARLLASRGARLVLGGRREAPLKALTEEIFGSGGEATYITTDVTRRKDLADLVALAGERYGRLDVFIGNAGSDPSPLSTICAWRIGRR